MESQHKRHAIFCTAAENNARRYLERVRQWHEAVFPAFGEEVDLFCFIDGQIDDIPELQGMTFITLTPKLGRTNIRRFEGYKRSFGKALETLRDYPFLMLIENDVRLLDIPHIREYWEKHGLYSSIDRKYNFIEAGMLILNDAATREKLMWHYRSPNGINEDEYFETILQKYPFQYPFKSIRQEGDASIDTQGLDYIAQARGMLDTISGAARASQRKKPIRLFLMDEHCPGDILEDTAIVRDLHAAHPEYHINVRTTAPELWENNPHIDRTVTKTNADKVLSVQMPLINQSNQTGVHVLDAIRLWLEDQLDIKIPIGPRMADIHLSDAEKQDTAWFARHGIDLAGLPVWLVTPCGKQDFTTKVWAFDRYQDVVNATRDRIQWVQVGAAEHNHTPLKNVIDLRGQTTHRELCKLMYRSSGVLCGITYLMHLATMPMPNTDRKRPCIVLNGGREPPSFTEYPAHTHLHTIGCLDCCRNGGCWKAKADKDCLHPVTLPTGQTIGKCMDIIKPSDVIAAIDRYLAY